MSPAPTSTTALDERTWTASESDPVNDRLFVTVTRTLSRPSAAYACETVIGDGVVVEPLLELPSPQVIAYAHGAALSPVSLNLMVRVTVCAGVVV